MRFRSAIPALALAIAATGASAAPIYFTTTISDGNDGVANFEITNGTNTGRSITEVVFSLDSDAGLIFDSFSNLGGSPVARITKIRDLDLTFAFTSPLTFLPGRSFTFDAVIRNSDDDLVDSATDALFGNLELYVGAGASGYRTTITSAETRLPDDGIDRGDPDEDNEYDGDDGNGGSGYGDGVASVPEPGTLALMGLGLMGLASTYRRRKS